MALNPNELVSSTTIAAEKRFFAEDNLVATLAPITGAPKLLRGHPMMFDEGIAKHVPLAAPADQVTTLTVDATGGTLTVTVNGVESAAIAYNANAATMKAALEAIAGVGVGGATVTGGPGDDGGTTPYSITWTGDLKRSSVTVSTDPASLTGGAGTAAVVTATAASSGVIGAFVWPADIQTHATNDVLGVLMTKGRFNATDVPLPTGMTQGELDSAIQGYNGSLIAKGLIPEGLAEIH